MHKLLKSKQINMKYEIIKIKIIFWYNEYNMYSLI